MSSFNAELTTLVAGRYFYFAMFTAVIWDHIINFDQEVEYIWKQERPGSTLRRLIPKINVMLHRYTMEGILLLNVIVISGWSSHINCKAYAWVSAVGGTTFAVVTQFMLIMRLYSSWDQGKMVKRIIVFITVVATLLVMAFIIEYVIRFQDKSIFIPVVNLCVPLGAQASKVPRVLANVYATVLAFHCIILGLIMYKVLEIPRKTNIEVLYQLQVAGFKAFMLLFFVNIASFTLTIIGNPQYQTFSSGLLLALMTIVNSRIHVGMEALKSYTPPSMERLYLVSEVEVDRRKTWRNHV